jgi:hypothetical protein
MVVVIYFEVRKEDVWIGMFCLFEKKEQINVKSDGSIVSWIPVVLLRRTRGYE